MNVIRSQPTMGEFRAMVDERGRISAVIPVPAGAMLDGLDWLNDYADDCLLPAGATGVLADISYEVVGFEAGQYDENYVKGLLYVLVDADADGIIPEED